MPDRERVRLWETIFALSQTSPAHLVETKRLPAKAVHHSANLVIEDFVQATNEPNPYPHLTNAPVVEAVVEIRCAPEVPWNEGTIRPKLDDLLSDYPYRQSVRDLSVTVQVDAQPQSANPSDAVATGSSSAWMGLRGVTEDKTQIATFTRTHFSFSRRKPYQDWSRFSNEALRMWEVHREIAAPSIVERVGVRFVNRIEIPGPINDLSTYFKGIGHPPVQLPLSGFLQRLGFRDIETRAQAILARAVERSTDADGAMTTLIVDVDAFCTESIDPDTASLRSTLDSLRGLKNLVFFESIHSDLVETFT